MNNHLDKIETMLAYFMYANAQDESSELGKLPKKQLELQELDAGVKLRFDPIYPNLAYTAQIDGERIYATSAELLLHPPQDIIGRHKEITLIHEDTLKWFAYKKINKRPRGVYVASPGADLYECHSRFIKADGTSDYRKRVAAISKHGRPVNTLIEGAKNQAGTPDGYWLILAASVVEDSMRPDVFQATVREKAGVILPVPQGEHLEVFRLRDGPKIENRRKALLHWVAKHTRRTKCGQAEVKEHLRGVHEFDIDGFKVALRGTV